VLPDVPTLKEMGVEGVDVQQWYGIFAPAKTPKALIDQLNKALNQVLNDKDVIKRIEDHGADVETSSPEQLGAMVKSAAHAIGSQLGRQIIRGVLGSILGGRSR